MNDSLDGRISQTVKYYFLKNKYHKHWVWSFIKALFHSVFNLFSWQLWYGVFLFFAIYCTAFAIYIAMRYIGGGVCLTLSKIIHVIDQVRDFFGMRVHIDVKAIDALAGLVDGTCDEFSHCGYTIRYWISRSMGNSLCEDMMWYESITLTRWFVSRPLSFLYIKVGVVPGAMCQVDLTWDMCAGVIGTKALLDFMVEKGLWILLIMKVTYPLIRYFMSRLLDMFHIVCAEFHFLLYSMQPRFKQNKCTFVNFFHRLHIFSDYTSSHTSSVHTSSLTSNDYTSSNDQAPLLPSSDCVSSHMLIDCASSAKVFSSLGQHFAPLYDTPDHQIPP
jgi:hypothetical protein